MLGSPALLGVGHALLSALKVDREKIEERTSFVLSGFVVAGFPGTPIYFQPGFGFAGLRFRIGPRIVASLLCGFGCTETRIGWSRSRSRSLAIVFRCKLAQSLSKTLRIRL